MNTKVLTGIVVVVVAIGVAFTLMHQPVSPVQTVALTPDLATSTPPITQPSKPSTNNNSESHVQTGTPSVKVVPAFAEFDSLAFTSTSTYPVVTGTANTPRVGIVINNSKDVGVVGTWEVPVVSGHWSYATSVALTPGSYTLLLFIGAKNAGTAKLVVTK